MHFAAEKGIPEIIDLLLDHPNIQVNIQDEEGKTPLHQASLCGMVESVEKLMSYPFTDLNMKNNVRKALESCSSLSLTYSLSLSLQNEKTALDVCGGNLYDWSCNDKPQRISRIKQLFQDKFQQSRHNSNRGLSFVESPSPSIFSAVSSIDSPSKTGFESPKSNELRHHLIRALGKKTCPWNRSKIMIVGPGRAGKSALTRSILGEPFEKDLQSTVGIQALTCDVKYTGLSTDGHWEKYLAPKKLLEEALAKEIYRMNNAHRNQQAKLSSSASKGSMSSSQQSIGAGTSAKTLGKKLSFKKSWSRMGNALNRQENHFFALPAPIQTANGNSPFPKLQDPAVFTFDSIPEVPHLDSKSFGDGDSDEGSDHDEDKKVSHSKSFIKIPKNNNIPSLHDIDSEVVMECLSKGIHLFDSKYIFSIYDFGGQSIFDVIHPFFLTRYGVYLIVFNMKDFFSSQEKFVQVLEHLKFWINSVAIHSFDKESSEMAPILFIGTRKDLISDPLQHEYISNQLFYYFHNHNSWPFVVPNTFGEGTRGSTNLFFFPINNTLGRNDPMISRLMISIEEIVSESFYIQEEIPWIWLQLIDRLKDMKRSFLTYPDVVQLFQQYSVGEETIPTFLSFCHEMSILMWDEEQRLKNIIILDPIEYFVKPATMIICKHSIAHPQAPQQLSSLVDSSSSSLQILLAQNNPSALVSDPTLHITPIHKKSMKHFFEDWQCMTKYGIITESLVKALLHHYDYKENIIYLMCKYGLLLPLYSVLKAKSFHMINNNRTYLVPSLLPELPLASFLTRNNNFVPPFRERPSYGISPFNETASLSSGSHPDKPMVFYFGFHLSSILKNKTIITLSMMKEFGFLPNGFFERLLCKIIPFCIEDEVFLEDKNISEYIFKNAVLLSYKGQEFHLFHLSAENIMKVEVLNGLNPIPIYLMLQRNLAIICKESYPNLHVMTLLEFTALNHSIQYQNKMKSFSRMPGTSSASSSSSLSSSQQANARGALKKGGASTLKKVFWGENEVVEENEEEQQEDNEVVHGSPYFEEEEKILIKLSTIEKCLQYNRDLEVSLMEVQNSVHFSQHHHQQQQTSSRLLSSHSSSHSASSASSSRPAPTASAAYHASPSAQMSFSHLKEKFSLSMLKTEYNVWMYQFKQRLMLTSYDIFLSYRWNARDSELVRSLFHHFLHYNISNHLYSPISVFLDHQRIQSGEEFREIFVSALLKSRIIIPVITMEALKGFIYHDPTRIDNLLLEWIISLVCYYHTADQAYSDEPGDDFEGVGKRRKILPIIMGHYEIEESSKDILKLGKISDLEDFEVTIPAGLAAAHASSASSRTPTTATKRPPLPSPAGSPSMTGSQQGADYKQSFKRETILAVLARTSNLIPTETMKCAEKLLKQNNIHLLPEIKGLTVHQIIEKLLLFQGILATNQLYQLPIKLERLTKEYSEKIMESLYSIYSTFEEQFHDPNATRSLLLADDEDDDVDGLSDLGEVDQEDPEESIRKKTQLAATASSALPPFPTTHKTLKKLTKSLYSASYQNLLSASLDEGEEETTELSSPLKGLAVQSTGGHPTSLLDYKQDSFASDLPGPRPYRVNQKTIEHHIQSILTLRSSQSWNDFYFYNRANPANPHTPGTTPSLGRDPKGLSNSRLSTPSNSQAQQQQSQAQQQGLVLSPKNSLFSRYSSTNSWSNDTVEGSLVPRNISQDSMLGTMSKSMDPAVEPTSLRTPLALQLPVPNPRSQSTGSTYPSSFPPSPLPPPASRQQSEQTITVPAPVNPAPPPVESQASRLDASFAAFSAEIDFLTQNHALFEKYLAYRAAFSEKNLARAKELQVEIKDKYPPVIPEGVPSSVYLNIKSRDDYRTRLAELLAKAKDELENELEAMALDQPAYFDHYLKCMEYEELLQSWLCQ